MSNNSPQEENPREEHRLDFFRPDQITFLVTHESNLDDRIRNGRLTDKILQEWSAELNEHLKRQKWMLSQKMPIRSYSFPALGDNVPEDLPDDYLTELFSGAPFSIIACNVERVTNQEQSDNKSTTLAENNKKRAEEKGLLYNLILSLDSEHENLSAAGLAVQGVFPNWIASAGSSNSGGTGGPGGRPVPYTDISEPAPAPFYFQGLVAQLRREDMPEKSLYGDGTNVDVIILDTAPSAHDLVLAHKELVLLKEDGKKHRLLEHLLGPGGWLKLYPATYEEQLRMGNTSLNQHGYKMADHGLFIAGIIHSIVPKATIHLIEMLNQFGVGDLETIASGLDKAFEICRQATGKAVINGSWFLDLPDLLKEFAYHPTKKEVIPAIEKATEEKLRKHLELEDKQLRAKIDLERLQDEHRWKTNLERLPDERRWVLEIRAICERFGKSGRQVVAAAGNQGDHAGHSRNAPDARYPAAFSKVIGVGALPKNAARNDGSGKYDASSFSNLADKPEFTGIMALGGEPGARNGVLGIYLGEFPPDEDASGRPINGHGWPQSGPKSTNGWAWWAGTSFATPILTGVIASVLSGPERPATTQRALEILYREGIILNALTEKDEDGMPSSLAQTLPPDNWP